MMQPRFLHYIQLVPLFLWVFSNTDYQSHFDFPILGYEKLFLIGLSLVSLVFVSFKKTVTNRFVAVCGVSGLFFLTLNRVFSFPTLGTFLISLTAMSVYFTLNKENTKHFKASILNIASAYLIPALLFVLLQTESEIDFNLYYFSVCLALSTGFFITSYHIDSFLKFRKKIFILFLLISGGLYYLSVDSYQEVLLLVLVLLNFIPLGFSLFKRENFDAVENFYRKVLSTPELAVIFYFLILASLGAFCLQLPWAQTASGEHSFLNSFFTSISAVCVTGLAVLDTSLDFSILGQSLILVLIQLGGLGIVSITTWALIILRKTRVSIKEEAAVTNISGYQTDLSPHAIMSRILTYFFVTEAVGSIILFVLFRFAGEDFASALWRGVFTSVSAFCNAGFSLQTESLIPYQTQPLVLLVVSFLLIAGGFSPLFALDLPKRYVKKNLDLNEKMILRTTLGLLLLGFVFMVFVEWNSSLKELSFLDKIFNAWFQSATTRTAGFNSIDFTELKDISSYFMLMLMFIGGNAGSTAGGVKTIIFAVLFLTALNALKGHKETLVFNRQISSKTVYRCISIFSLALVVNFFVFFALSMTQNMESLPLFFESFSALGTVGLSLGATPSLDEVGKVIVMAAMIVGRIGPLTFILLMKKGEDTKVWKYPEEDIFIS